MNLPVDNQSEAAVIGAVFVDQKSFDVAEDLGLTAEDFWGKLHQRVWKAMAAIKGKCGQIDLLTVRNEVNQHGGLSDCGGESALAKLASGETTSARVEAHTQIVIEHSCRRSIIVAAQKAAVEAQDGQRPSEEIISDAGIKFLELTRTRGQGVERHVEVHVSEAIRQIEDRAAGKSKGISTGILDMDMKIGGFYPTDMIVLASRPGVGKTALALNWAWSVAAADKVVLFYSLEMSSVQLSDRLISIVGHIDGWKIRTGKLASTDWVMLSQAAGTLTSKRLFIDDRPDVSIHGIRAGARRVLAREGHLDLVVVDYLQLMQSHSSARQQDRHLEVGAISRGLKKLAKELNTTVVAVAQLNRKIEDRGDTANPRLADIRESGSIEADADIVIMLTGGKNKDTTAHVLKQRHGPTGVIDLMFDASQGKFGCVDYVHKQEAQEGDPTWRP